MRLPTISGTSLLCVAAAILCGCGENVATRQTAEGDPPIGSPAAPAAPDARHFAASSGPSPQRELPLEEDEVSEAAAKALGRIGEPAVAGLAEALSDPDPATRLLAAQTLARIGPDAGAAVPALIRALDDGDEQVRRAAARALGQIGPEAQTAVPALIQALREPPSFPASRSYESGGDVAPAAHYRPID